MQKWRKSKSIENYSKSISFHEIKSLSFQFETVKNLEFLIQDHISKQEKVLWKGVKNLHNSKSFYLLKNKIMKKNVMVWFPKKKTFRNSTTDNEKWLILAWINLALAVYFSIFAIGFGLFIFNCYFVYKWATKS